MIILQIVKYIGLIIVFIGSTYIGNLISKKYYNRVKELKEMEKALHIFETKIKFTYEPIPQIFEEISKKLIDNISQIFKVASTNMKSTNAGDAWVQALEQSNTNLKKEDIDTLKNLSSLLGKIDIDGQVSQINLVESFLDEQIKSAEEEKNKYSKMYKTLGITIGLTIVIILI